MTNQTTRIQKNDFSDVLTILTISALINTLIARYMREIMEIKYLVAIGRTIFTLLVHENRKKFTCVILFKYIFYDFLCENC